MDGAQRRYQRRDLRRAARTQRGRSQKRRGPVFHAPPADRRHGHRHGPATGANDPRSRLWHGGLPAVRMGPYEASSARGGSARSDEDAHEFSGVDIVPDVVRLCAMNLYLHGAATAESPIERADALNSLGSVRYDVVLTNPPFGRKQGYKIVGDDGENENE